MKKLLFFIGIMLMGLYLTSVGPERQQSEAYFKENQVAIEQLVRTFRQVNQAHRISFGYLDNAYQQYLVQVYTDSVRFVYKSDVTIDQQFKELQEIAIDSVGIRELAQKVIQARAIWIESQEIYLSGFPQKGTFISFQSQRINSPFTPTKFLALLVLDDNQSIQLSEEELEQYNIYPIQPGIYHTISTQFR